MTKSIPVSAEVVEAYEAKSQEFGLLPIKVSPFYDSLVQEEIDAIGVNGPLYRNVYPTMRRLELQTPFEVDDFVTDKDNMGEDAEHVYVQKYGNRILALTTEHCFSNCSYCFRTSLLSEEAEVEVPKIDPKIDILVEAVSNNLEIKEVILSGGDPLAIGYKALERLFSRLREARPDIDLRIHTRAIAFAPHVFRDALVQLLGENEVRTYFHITHPYEITDRQKDVFKCMREANVRMYNQSPIIRGVNDHADVIKMLVANLDSEHVRPLSFFIPDPIRYSADFRVPLEKLFGIIEDVRWTLPSWAATFRLVLDTPVGKVRQEDIKHWDKENNIVIFEREGKEVTYHDLPEDMYMPSDLAKLLWKE